MQLVGDFPTHRVPKLFAPSRFRQRCIGRRITLSGAPPLSHSAPPASPAPNRQGTMEDLLGLLDHQTVKELGWGNDKGSGSAPSSPSVAKPPVSGDLGQFELDEVPPACTLLPPGIKLKERSPSGGLRGVFYHK